jgi:hypothetical protein
VPDAVERDPRGRDVGSYQLQRDGGGDDGEVAEALDLVPGEGGGQHGLEERARKDGPHRRSHSALDSAETVSGCLHDVYKYQNQLTLAYAYK